MPHFNFIEKINQLTAIVGHAWHDRRVPMAARICLLLAPLYWLCPFDLIADQTPGGYVDDAVIVPLLICLALFLVPRVVYQDARRAKAQFACGLLFLGFSGIVPPLNLATAAYAKTNAFQGSPTTKGVAINEYAGLSFPAITCGEAQVANSASLPIGTPFTVKAPQAEHASIYTTIDCQRLPGLACNHCGKSFFDSVLVPDKVMTSLASSLRACKKHVFFIVRGGQSQLYAEDDNSQQNEAAIFFHGSQMPLHLAGGIFVANITAEMLPSGDCS